ncbi:MAG: SDR family oxidoreductase [Alphaproteobacteria bacterium]|nr:MAG: SDR family oxidoreductase [Alphaproteobacteria bacterium]
MGQGVRQAVITGGGSGIGLAIARRLSADGATVLLLGRSEDRLRAAQQAVPDARIAACDVADEDSVKRVLSGFGSIDILVNNAGIVETALFLRIDDDAWRRMVDVNLMGAVHCIRAVLPAMTARGRGRIINIASTAALKGYAYASAYAATKHALLGLTRSLALELARTEITVNAVCPGYTETAIVEAAVARIAEKTGRGPEEARAALEAANPQGRLIKPEEVAQAVAWLVSPEARAITGQAIAVAGGEVM